MENLHILGNSYIWKLLEDLRQIQSKPVLWLSCLPANQVKEEALKAIPKEHHQHCVRKGNMGTKGQYELSR